MFTYLANLLAPTEPADFKIVELRFIGKNRLKNDIFDIKTHVCCKSQFFHTLHKCINLYIAIDSFSGEEITSIPTDDQIYGNGSGDPWLYQITQNNHDIIIQFYGNHPYKLIISTPDNTQFKDSITLFLLEKKFLKNGNGNNNVFNLDPTQGHEANGAFPPDFTVDE